MMSISKLLFSLIILLISKSVLCVENDTSSIKEPPNVGFEYELMEEKIDTLHYSFKELFVHVKELGELVVNNQRTIEQNQFVHVNQLGELIANNQRSIKILEEKLSTNVALITNYSKQILDYQTICANHDEIRKQLSSLKPSYTHSRGAPVAKIISERHARPTIINSCKEINSTSTGLFEMVGINGGESFKVLCEMAQFDGGWLVFQRRFNGSVDFYRNWTEYKNGFGDVEGEFWLGLERIHQLTNKDSWELIVEMEDFSGSYMFARYSVFSIEDESENYALTNLGSYSGTAGDYLKYHSQMKFSTFDRDDGTGSTCAVSYHGAWWYKSCYESNLNGLYANKNEYKEIKWNESKPSLKYTRMMIREI